MDRLGLIGHPVGHSMSQVMHSRVFREMEINAEYGLHDVLPEELGFFMKDAGEKFSGLNVTIPHKVEVMQYLDGLSREAELIGAVNTIKYSDGVSRGYNTDGIGFVKSLAHEGVDVAGKRILIVGAGGAARAISFQSILEGAEVTICNRRQEMQMAENLASEIREKTGRKAEALPLDRDTLKEQIPKADILAHATPVGMHPNKDSTLIPCELVREGLVVADIVYNPVETRLLREAGQAGAKIVSGVGMLVHQGAQGLRIWLGIEPPVESMYKAVLENLGSK